MTNNTMFLPPNFLYQLRSVKVPGNCQGLFIYGKMSQ